MRIRLCAAACAVLLLTGCQELRQHEMNGQLPEQVKLERNPAYPPIANNPDEFDRSTGTPCTLGDRKRGWC